MWEDGLAASECALERVCLERDAERVQAETTQQNYHAKMRASGSRSKHSINLNRTLEERQVLLCLQETDLEVQEVMLAEEQACDLHPFNRRGLSAEEEGLHTCMDEVEGERATEVGQLSQLVTKISNTLVNLGMLPIWDILELLKSAQLVFAVTSLILEHL
jgi:hypothetical protein